MLHKRPARYNLPSWQWSESHSACSCLTLFLQREYSKAVQTAMTSLKKQDLSFLNTYRFQFSDIHKDMLKFNPSPKGRLAGSSYTVIIENDLLYN